MKDYKEISAMKDAELVAFVAEQREALRAVRFGKVERNTSSARVMKTNIARALTEQTKRHKTAASAA